MCSELVVFFFFKQKTAYEVRISDWSSDVCSSDLQHALEVCLRNSRDITNGQRQHRQDQQHGLPVDSDAMQAFHQQTQGNGKGRSEERRVGKECVSTCSSRWSTYPYKQKTQLLHILSLQTNNENHIE